MEADSSIGGRSRITFFIDTCINDMRLFLLLCVLLAALVACSGSEQNSTETFPIDPVNFDDFWEQYDNPSEPVAEEPNLIQQCREHHPNARRTIEVPGSDSRRLQDALNSASPGTLVVVNRGIYATNQTLTRTFEVKNKRGSRYSPVTICGPEARLDGNRRHAGLLLYKSRFVKVVGLTVQNAAKGIKMWTVSDCTLDGVTVDGTNVGASLERTSPLFHDPTLSLTRHPPRSLLRQRRCIFSIVRIATQSAVAKSRTPDAQFLTWERGSTWDPAGATGEATCASEIALLTISSARVSRRSPSM